MYCTSCGTQLDATLNFCNRCGKPVPKPASQSIADQLAQGVSYVGGFGLLGFIFVAVVLLQRGVGIEALIPISFFYLAALVAICWLMLKYSAQMSRPQTLQEKPAESEPANYLSPLTTAQLDEARQQPASVVEQTTRALDEVAVRR